MNTIKGAAAVMTWLIPVLVPLEGDFGTGLGGHGRAPRLIREVPALYESGVPRRSAVEKTVPRNAEDAAVLGRPLALAIDGDRLYIADALDCAVKVFSTEGRFLMSFGRKGRGPGELSFPSGVCVTGGTVAVADKLNLRIQTFDPAGHFKGGFRLPFAPDRVLSLGPDRLLVTSNPTGRKPGEKLLHIYDLAGRSIWDGLPASSSADPVADAFRNMIIVCGGPAGDFFVIFRSGVRAILHFDGTGALLARLDVDPRHASRGAVIARPDGALALDGFCWAAALAGGEFFLSPPEALAGRDLGPGKTVSIVDGEGRLRAVVDLPCPVHRFAVNQGRMYAIDDEGEFRIFEVGR